MKLGEVLYKPGVPVRYVYFPATAIVAARVIENGASAEITVGNEGILGISCPSAEAPASQAIRCKRGFAFRIKAQHLKAEFGRFGPLLPRGYSPR